MRKILWLFLSFLLFVAVVRCEALEPEYDPSQAGIEYLAFSPDGRALAGASLNRPIKLWDMASGKVLCKFTGNKSRPESLAFSPDGRILATANNDVVELWDVSSGKKRRVLTEVPGAWTCSDCKHTLDFHCVAFSPDGKMLANPNHRAISLWDVASGKKLQCITGHTDDVTSVAFSPDGKILASGSPDKTIRLWSLPSGHKLRALSTAPNGSDSVVFNPTGTMIASSSYDDIIKVWDVRTGKPLRPFTGGPEQITSASFSPDGKILATGSMNDKTVDLWDVASRKRLRSLKGHSWYIRTVAFSPDGKLLASGSSDETIKLWDVSTAKEIHTISNRADEPPKPAVPKSGHSQRPITGLNLGWKVMFAFAFLFIIACFAAVFLGAIAAFLTRGISKQSRKSAIFAAALFPFAFLAWSCIVAEISACMDQAVFDREPFDGELYECALPNGYGITMIDDPDVGSLYNRKEDRNPEGDRIIGFDADGHPERSISNGISEVRQLQLARQYVFASTDDPRTHFKDDYPANTKMHGRYILLDTQTDRQIEFNSYQELERAATQLGVRLNLRPIDDIYEQYHATWFDRFVPIILFVPPGVAFGVLIWQLILLKKSQKLISDPN